MTGGLRTPPGSCTYDNYGSIRQHMLPTLAGRRTTRSTYDLSVRMEVCRKSTTKCTQFIVITLYTNCSVEKKD
jgi:hypothetical protein